MQEIQEFEKRLSSWMGRTPMTKERERESMRVMEWAPLVDISEDDVKTVVEQTSCSEEKARELLEKHNGDLAAAIMELQEE